MKSGRVFFTCVSTAALAWVGCTSGDTVVALNVNVGSGVGAVSKLHVEIDQAGQSPFNQDITMLPTMDIDAGIDAAPIVVLMSGALPPVRLTLPSSWVSGEALVKVTSYDATGQLYLTAPPINVQIVAQGVVAAFVNLALPMPDAGTDGGAEDGAVDDGAAAEGGPTEAGPAEDTGAGEAAADASADSAAEDAGLDARPADAATDGG